MTNKAQYKNTILTQVLVYESSCHLLVAIPFDLVHQTKMLPDVAVTITAEGHTHDPGQQAEAGQSSHEHHPEPNKQVYLLVEEIDGQNALHRVALNVTQPSHVEVAHRDSWKSSRFSPINTLRQRFDHFYTVEMEIRAEKSIQQEQLTDNVYNEDDLGEYVEDDQVVSETTTADNAACARETMFETDGASCPVFTLTSKISAKRKRHTLNKG